MQLHRLPCLLALALALGGCGVRPTAADTRAHLAVATTARAGQTSGSATTSVSAGTGASTAPPGGMGPGAVVLAATPTRTPQPPTATPAASATPGAAPSPVPPTPVPQSPAAAPVAEAPAASSAAPIADATAPTRTVPVVKAPAGPAAPQPAATRPDGELTIVIPPPAPARRGAYAHIAAESLPGATCRLSVRPAGAGTSIDYIPKRVGADGSVGWTVEVAATLKPGAWPLTVRCQQGSAVALAQRPLEVR